MSLSTQINRLARALKIDETKYDNYNKIIPRLYIGNYKAARDREFMEKHNIKAVLNCTKDLPNSFRSLSDVEYMRIPVDDSLKTIDIKKLARFFQVATAFIDKHINIENHNILVHCVEGSQRSCAVVAAYLMRCYGMTALDACTVVLKNRHKAFHHGSNVNFEESLVKYKPCGL